MPGGALCMEVLTPHGWTPATSIESLLVTIRFHLAEQEIKQIGEGESPAEYTRERAIASFQQIVEIHGWQNAPEFPGAAAKKKP